MATDSKKKSGYTTGYERVAAISRFLRKKYDIRTTNGTRGLEGVGVSKGVNNAYVWLHVALDDKSKAIEWAREIAQDLEDAGYQVKGYEHSLSITHTSWLLKDKIYDALFRCLAAGRTAIESDTALIQASERTIQDMRNAGFLEDGTLRLTEFGQQARALVLAENKKRAQAERRRLRERGW